MRTSLIPSQIPQMSQQPQPADFFPSEVSPSRGKVGNYNEDNTHCSAQFGDVIIQYRNKTGQQSSEEKGANRHSYHGASSLVTPAHQMMDYRYSYAPDTAVYARETRKNTLTSQRSLDDWENYRCARKRLSGNFGYLSVLPEDSMNSNDSVVGGARSHVSHVDTMQQGPDMQDSPRSGSSIVSGVSMKREDSGHPHQQHPQSQHIIPPQGGIPLQGQVLVDPATGQHYIVPQAAFYQPVQPVQPMYYPPPQPTPMYYHHHQYGQQAAMPQQGYMIPPTSGHGPVPQQGAYPVPMHPSTANYPPGGQRSFSGTPPLRHGYAQSVTSNEDVSRRDADERRFDDHPPMSPTLSTHLPPQLFPAAGYPPGTHITSFAQQYRQYQQPTGNARGSPNSQPEDPESGRDSFRRDVTRSSAEFAARSSGEFSRDFARQGSGGEGRYQRNGSGNDIRHGSGTDLQTQNTRHGSGTDLHGMRHGSGGDLRRDSGELQRPREGGDSQRSLPERTPLYGGPPQWWGSRGSDQGTSLTDVESKRVQPSISPKTSAVSDSETAGRVVAARPPPAKPVRMDINFDSTPNEEPQPKPKPTNRSLRMDFDLSKTLPEEEELLAKKKAAPRVPATAFTVNFDAPAEGVSLQEAARKSAQARRVLGRRSGGGAGITSSSGQDAQVSTPLAPSQPNNKSFLLNKLLHGGSGDSGAASEFTDLPEGRDNDVISETGTFVVDVSTRANVASTNNMMGTRIIEDSDDSTDTESESGSSRSASPAPAQAKISPRSTGQADGNDNILSGLCRLRQMAGGVGIRPTTAPAQPPPAMPPIRPSRLSTAGHPATAQPLPPIAKRSSLGSQPLSSAAVPAPSNRSVLGGSASATRLAHHANTTSSSTSSTTTANTFRRGDGGRFSMRGGASSQTGAASPLGPKRPPFRAGGAPVRTPSNPVKQREQEMTAWLRRKDYNPMKAAAEAKKNREQQARGDQFVSNRSISFHVGPTGSRPRQPSGSELSRNRSQESLAADEAEQASQRIVAEYSRGVVNDINKLSQQSTKARATGKQMTGLARAVDMLSQKCKKSIELIRSQNKGCLSVSVEDLLSVAADPPRDDESLNEQLERLSDAFDAVQRYLEQYSLDGHQSPIPEFNEEPETSSVISGFSGFSLRSHQLSKDRDSARAAAGSSTVNASPTSQAGTSTYRSRILANRSPSTGRPGRDN